MWINGFWQSGFWVSGFWEGDGAPPEPSGALNPLAVAVQGIGFGGFLASVQGFYATDGGGGGVSLGGWIPILRRRRR